jgi:P-type Cu2+ transporter
MEHHQHSPEQQAAHKVTNEMNEMDHSKMDHSKMDHSSGHPGANPAIGMEGHDHHAMMINDFKKRFFITLVLTVPICCYHL